MLAAQELNWTDADLHKNSNYVIQNKFDGVRAAVLVRGGEARLVTRTTKRYIQNKYVQQRFACHYMHGCDGELVLPGADFHTTSGVIRSRNDERGKQVCYLLFDNFSHPHHPYSTRYDSLMNTRFPAGVHVVQSRGYPCANTEVLDEELTRLDLPFEGYIVRRWNAAYKFGRATLNEASLLKLVSTKELVVDILRVDQLYSEVRGEWMPMMGSLWCAAPEFRYAFGVGSGFTQQQRIDAWKSPRPQSSKILIKYKPEGSTKDAPRQPVFIRYVD